MEPIVVVKERTALECVSDGLETCMKLLGRWVRILWPLLLVYSLAAPLLLVWGMRRSFEAIMAGSGANAALADNPDALWQMSSLMVVFLVVGLMSLVVQAVIVVQQRHLAEQGFLPRVAWRADAACVGKMVFRLFLLMLVMAILLIPFCIAPVFMIMGSAWLDARLSLGWLGNTGILLVGFLLWLLLLTYVFSAYTQLTIEYLYGEKSLLASLKSIDWGRRAWGHTTLVLFLAILAALLCEVLFNIPMAVVQLVDFLSVQSTLMGDGGQLPSYMPVVRFVVNALSCLGSCLGGVVVLFPLHFLWGSRKASAQPASEV